MKKNLGNLDRLLRVVLALVIGVLFYLNVISGTVGVVLVVVAGVLALTSLAGFCPLYAIVGINTCPIKSPNHK